MTKKENNRLEQKIRNKIEKEGRLVDNNKNKILRSYLYLLEYKSVGIPSLADISSYTGLSINTVNKHVKNIVGDIQSSNNFEANALRELLFRRILDKAFEGDVKGMRLAAECCGMLNQQQQNQVLNQQVIYEVKVAIVTGKQ